MHVFIQQLVNGVSLGGMYALLALGLAMVYSIMGLLNFAYGELITITGYLMFLAASISLPFIVAVIAGVMAATISAILMERIAFRPLRGASPEILMLASFGITLVLQVVYQTTVSPNAEVVTPPSFFAGSVTFFGIFVGVIQLVALSLTAVIVVVLTLFLRRSIFGFAMRAAASDFETARLMGVRADVVISLAFAISGALAGFAALLYVVQRRSVDPFMGLPPVIIAFVAIVLGGLGSLVGAALGGMVLGVTEVMMQAYLPNALQPYLRALEISMVVACLVVRPQGLLGSGEPWQGRWLIHVKAVLRLPRSGQSPAGRFR